MESFNVEDKVGEDYYSHDGVTLQRSTLPDINGELYDNPGTLVVTCYNSNVGKCIEWRQCFITSEAEEASGQDWQIVRSSKLRARTVSECSTGPRVPNLQIKLSDLHYVSFCTRNNSVTLYKKDKKYVTFSFQRGSTEDFAKYLSGIIPCEKKKNTYYVKESTDGSNSRKSFSDIKINNDNSWDNYRRYPVDTAMGLFAAISSYLMSEEKENEVEEILNQSFQSDESDKKLKDEYEVVNNKILLPPRTLASRIPPLSLENWTSFFCDDGSIVEEKIIKELIFHGGVHPLVRKEVWLFLLEFYPWNSTHLERNAIKKMRTDEYLQMKLQWKSMTKGQEERNSFYKERKSIIEKDVIRTDRTHPLFKEDNSPHLQKIEDILKTYAMYNFDLGYAQGMNDLLAPLLSVIEDEVETFWCFTNVVNRMIKNFDFDQEGMKLQLQQLYTLLCTIDPLLASFLKKQDSSNMFFCFRWIIIWFKREFTYEDIFVLWEALWAETCCPNYHLLICIAILDTEKEALMKPTNGFTDILKHVNELTNKIDLTLTLQKAEGIYQQLADTDDTPNPVREILGLPLLPEPAEASSGSCNDQNRSSPSSSFNASPPYDMLEKDLETSMSLNLL